MPRKKSFKKQEVKTFKNSFFPLDGDKEADIMTYFNNSNPITLEIGCGHADITLKSAVKCPKRNYIGVDVKKARLWKGATEALNLNLKNAAFLCVSADKLNEFFTNEKISEIWIPFPDPHPRRRSENKRLISPPFLNIYKQILNKDGKVHFKTDNSGLFDYAVELFKKHDIKILDIRNNIYINGEVQLEDNIQTVYEKHYLAEGRIIKYICFSF